MKSKIISHLLERNFDRKKESNKNLDRSRIKVEIENMCEKYLESSNELLEFEVHPRDLDHVVSIVESEAISKYDVFQIDKTLFGAKLKEVELI